MAGFVIPAYTSQTQTMVVFAEEFTGDTIETQFQLTGALMNGTWDSGFFQAFQILTTKPSSATKVDGDSLYDSTNIFTRNRITVSSISAEGLVTLSHPPMVQDFWIWYWYDLTSQDRIGDYVRYEHTGEMESGYDHTHDPDTVLPEQTGHSGEYLRTNGVTADWASGGGGGDPMYIFLKSTGLSEGDLHLSDGVNWNTNKAMLMEIEVETSSADWDLYVLQNDNGFAIDDANINARLIMEGGNGNEHIFPEIPYEDEDGSSELHLYYLDNIGTATMNVIITGYKLS